MINEKEMEDQIAQDPIRFLGESGLSLVARQLHIDRYIFDLLFQDRHGAKLIVEIQKGTLDRNHTYKILDYYDQYKEENPTEFIEVMVIANCIPAERKKRLQALGVDFREIPEQEFLKHSTATSNNLANEAAMPDSNTAIPVPDAKSPPSKKGEHRSYSFRSLGPSAFVKAVRKSISSLPISNRFKLGGESSLTAEFVAVTKAIEHKFGAGLVAQIWMERPKNRKAACKFEIAYEIPTLSDHDSKALRERIAGSMRTYLAGLRLPDGASLSGGSTVVKCILDLPAIQNQVDDTEANSMRCSSEIEKVRDFVSFMDSALSNWIKNQFNTEFKTGNRGGGVMGSTPTT